jgi:hypothetical protein
MLKGIHLSLMIGPAVPLPAPQPVIDALISVQVTSGKEKSGFQLTFALSKKSLLMTTLLPVGYFDPMITRVIIIVSLGGFPNAIMDGMVTRQELTPSSEPGQSTLTITGEDLSILMDVVEMPFMRYPATPDIGQIYQILAKYLVFGIVPLAIPPFINDAPLPTKKIPTHQGTDLAYLKKLANDHAYVFYVEPGPLPGESIAYWGPDIRIPVPQPALNINMDAHTNVEAMSFSLDGLAKKIVVLGVYDPATGKVPIPVPLPNVNIFRPPLGLRPTVPSRVEFPDWSFKEEFPGIVDKALGVLARSSDSITVQGSLDVLRYGHVLRSRMLVGVRGAGMAYDGLYYVNSVTHNIKRGEYKQSFQLSRDGLISITPKVPV